MHPADRQALQAAPQNYAASQQKCVDALCFIIIVKLDLVNSFNPENILLIESSPKRCRV